MTAPMSTDPIKLGVLFAEMLEKRVVKSSWRPSDK
jgi:hypothetical protein